MKTKYNFTYTKNQIGAIKYFRYIAPFVIVFITWLSGSFGLILFSILSFSTRIDYYPMVYFLEIWNSLSLIPFLVFLIYFIYFNYNTSLTYIHWDFNQEIEIDGNELTAVVTNGNDQFHETIHINKIKKRKYATFYYESRHRFVAIPSEVSAVQEGN